MIARYLNDLKKARNMSWSEIANLSSVPQQTVRNIFSGETQNPSFMAVASIVTAMGGSLDEMMEIPRELPPPSDLEVMPNNYEARLERTKRSYEDRIVQFSGQYERQIQLLTESNERRVSELNQSFERRIAELNQSFELRTKESIAREEQRAQEAVEREKRDGWKQMALMGLVLVLIIIIFYLVLDAMHGGWGIFQYQEQLASLRGTRAALWGGAARL